MCHHIVHNGLVIPTDNDTMRIVCQKRRKELSLGSWFLGCGFEITFCHKSNVAAAQRHESSVDSSRIQAPATWSGSLFSCICIICTCTCTCSLTPRTPQPRSSRSSSSPKKDPRKTKQVDTESFAAFPNSRKNNFDIHTCGGPAPADRFAWEFIITSSRGGGGCCRLSCLLSCNS